MNEQSSISDEFAILFTDAPLEYLDDDLSIPSAIGCITIGTFQEEFVSSLFQWDKSAYLAQWKRAILQIIGGANKTALITEFVSPEFADNCTLWPLYRVKDVVYVQNRILFYSPDNLDFLPEEVEQFVLERRQTNEDGDFISEWSVHISALKIFANSL